MKMKLGLILLAWLILTSGSIADTGTTTFSGNVYMNDNAITGIGLYFGADATLYETATETIAIYRNATILTRNANAATVIQAAIDDAGVHSIYLSSAIYDGKYDVDTELTLPTSRPLRIFGDGESTILSAQAGITAGTGLIYATACSDIIIENLRIDGNGNAPSCIRLDGASGTYIDRALIRNVNASNSEGYGIFIDYGRNCSIIGGRMTLNDGASEGRGIYLYNSTGMLIDGAVTDSNKRYGVVLHTCTDSTVMSTTATNHGGDRGIYLYNSDRIIVNGCHASYNNFSGICIGGISSDCIISDCDVHHQTLDGILVRNDDGVTGTAHRNTIAANKIHDNTRSGIIVDDDMSEIVVRNNDIYNNGYDGIEIWENVNESFIQGNYILDNAEHGIYASDKSADDSYNLWIDGNYITQRAGTAGKWGIRLIATQSAYVGYNRVLGYANGVYDGGTGTKQTTEAYA